MLRRITAMIVIFSFLTLSGCQNEITYSFNNSYDSATDCAYYLPSSLGLGQVAEGETGFYLSIGCFLMYTDRETLTTIPLCSKSNCLHQKEPDEEKWELCDAYFPRRSEFSPIFCLDRYLYICAPSFSGQYVDNSSGQYEYQYEYSVIRMNTDGSERKELFSIPGKKIKYACIHRGVFYYIVDEFSENGDAWCRLYAHSLNSNSAESTILYQAENTLSHGLFNGLFAYGQYLYLLEYTDELSVTLRIIDLKTNQNQILTMPDGMNVVSYPLIYGGRLICYFMNVTADTGAWYDESIKTAFYSYKLDGSEPELLSDSPCGGVWTDGKYIYRNDPRRGDVKQESLHIMNADMKDVCTLAFSELMLPDYELVTIRSVVPLRGGQILIHAQYKSGLYVFYSLDCADFEAGTIAPQAFFQYIVQEYSPSQGVAL